MQCPSCRFENMPGLESCGRCGTSLSLSTVTIDVNPPRASKAAKRLRKAVPRRLIYRARDLASEAHRVVTRSTVEDSRIPLPEPAILSRLIVPGWAHMHSGLAIRGSVFLAAYLPLLLLGLAGWGSGLASILLGLAFSVHASSVVDILVRQGTVRFPKMMATTLLVSLILAVLVYVPAGQVLARMAAPIQYRQDARPFQRYDVVLINEWAYALTAPRRGDIVQFRPTYFRRQAPSGFRGRGGRHDRSHRRCSRRPRHLGRRPPHDQRNAGRMEAAGPRAVAETPGYDCPRGPLHDLADGLGGCAEASGAESFWKLASMVGQENILGRAFLRRRPIWRYWFMR